MLSLSGIININCKLHRYVFLLAVACLTFTLVACDKDTSGGVSAGDGLATITVSANNNNQIGTLATRSAVSGLPLVVSRLDVSVLRGEKVLGSADLFLQDILSVQVPAGVELRVTGTAYAGNNALFQGETLVEALIPNSRQSISLKLTPIGPLTAQIFDQPVQVDVSNAGDAGNLTSNVDPWFAFSNGNKKVLFTANSSNLSQNDTNNARDVFSRDLISDEMTNLHTSGSGVLADADVNVADISADGRYVVFTSDASNLVSADTNEVTDVFIKNTQTGVVTRISETDSGGQISQPINTWPQISDNGQRAVISLNEALLLNDTNVGVERIYLYDVATETNKLIAAGVSPVISGDGKFIAFLLQPVTSAGNMELVRYEVATEQSIILDTLVFEARLKAISRDGRYVAFLAMDSQNGNKIRRHDFINNATLTASIDSNGNLLAMGLDLADDLSPSIPNISADGRYIAFGLGTSSYVKDMQGIGELKEVIASMWPALSPDGELIAYLSTNNNNSLFVAANPVRNQPGLFLDTDSDGLPDYWETNNGLDLSDPGDALLDNDTDGLSNLAEFQQGTNPGIANLYEVVEIGSVQNNRVTVPTAIDDNGNVVGYACDFCGQSNTGFSWDETNELFILDGNVGGISAYRINLNDISNGVAVGENSPSNFGGVAFSWSYASATASTFSNDRRSAANGINTTGQIAGQRYQTGSTNWVAVRWEDVAGIMIATELGTLGGDTSVANSLNDQGQVVGVSKNLVGDNNAFLWQAEEESMISLGTLSGKFSSASDINNKGQVVGSSDVDVNNVTSQHAFLWSVANGMQDLGTIGGATSRANAINENSQVVGDGSVAFIWANNQMIDLNTLLPPGSNVTISSAKDINNKGEIVATGSKIVDGVTTNIAVLLKPLLIR